LKSTTASGLRELSALTEPRALCGTLLLCIEYSLC
jgi:hypothetical protein